MGDRVSIRGTFLPSQGYTVTADALHRIVDEAVVEIDDNGLVAGDGTIMVAPTYTAVAATLQWNPDTACKMVHAEGSNEINISAENFLTKSALALYPTYSAASETAHSYKGMPAWFPARTPVREWVWDNGTIPGGRHKTEHTPAAGDARTGYVFPIVTGDPKPYLPTFATLFNQNSTNRTCFRHYDPVGVFARDTDTEQHNTQLTEVIMSGPAQVMVHADLSSSFDPNDLYCMYYAVEGQLAEHVIRQPVSWHGSSVTTATRCQIPWGVIRHVYTESGVTMVRAQQGDIDYTLDAQPYYVADVWLWGTAF